MCSWCWGFTPVIERVREAYRAHLKIALVLGGLRSDALPQTPAQRDEILHHWREVNERSGQPFRFENAMPQGFVYDTEPPSRAVIAAGSLDAALTFPMYKAIQAAFYAGGRDVTQAGALAEIADDLGLDRTRFVQAFESETARAQTQAHFQQARQLGVRGFPTLILQHSDKLHLVTHGWQPLERIRAILDAQLGNGA